MVLLNHEHRQRKTLVTCLFSWFLLQIACTRSIQLKQKLPCPRASYHLTTLS